MALDGTRQKYLDGCRCDPCRAANTEYLRQRRAPGEVDATAARKHLLMLRRFDIGTRAVADSCDLDRDTVWRIVTGRRATIHATTAAKILSVDKDARADGSRVRAGNLRGMINLLVERGWTKRFLTRQLGLGSLPLRHRRITARNAMRIERLYRDINAGRVSR
jgi:hypothetical protein